VVRTSERRLYYVLGDGRAIRYPVGVGMASKQWTGTTRIDGKYLRPAWSPPREVKRDKPSLPDVIPGGSPRNPMGEAALTLAAANTRSTAPTCRARSAASCPMAASACSTRTSSTSTVA
jgi:lipoprotein-anchoring transpeptidase ErfK/SrfK